MRTDARRGRLATLALLCVLLGCAALAACDARGDQAASELPTATIVVGNNQPLHVEIAATRAHRGRGLMFRKSLPDDHGMLFMFPEERVLEFWMRNTHIPLSIAFADASGRILRIEDMQPLSDAMVSSGAPARYALEVNSGWFARHGVQPGDDLRDLPKIGVE